MGVFDQEASFTLESTPEAGPETVTMETATQTEEGHVETNEEATEAPETTETTSTETTEKTTTEEVTPESKATQEVEKDKQQDKPKKFADKYDTIGKLINGVNEAAKLVGVDINWNELDTPEKMVQVYQELRQQISKGEAKNIIEKTPETIKQDIQTQQSVLDQELQKIIETNTTALKQIETESDDDNDEDFEMKFAENPKQALAERDAKREAKLRKEFEAKINLEGAKVIQQIAPFIERMQAQDAKEAGTKPCNNPIPNQNQVNTQHG
jgi:hypothetical protein